MSLAPAAERVPLVWRQVCLGGTRSLYVVSSNLPSFCCPHILLPYHILYHTEPSSHLEHHILSITGKKQGKSLHTKPVGRCNNNHRLKERATSGRDQVIAASLPLHPCCCHSSTATTTRGQQQHTRLQRDTSAQGIDEIESIP